ncbi:hypothetical protein GYMLUDRAFT_1017494 [Collybiopsis luxurians FD-317 M1]|uniref:G domain-containing protein n=1 Tax=Collybiopsis luxurians FD-317 M1 TaxID=944289 RepID=A0A0D0BLJ8_9AGAR|nr:hypothetical protein GYMLUDRAFT_1017494 [Collybiopsis luxurians FD-317 M1]
MQHTTIPTVTRPERSLSLDSTSSTNTISREFEQFADIALKVKEYCPRIRILVIGRRNAGKTTLLQKVARNSVGTVIIRNKEGKLVGSTLTCSIQQSSLHTSTKFSYYSDEDYVFHDSRGVEAGFEEELNIVKEFIKNKQEKRYLSQRIHVIWLCLPVDNDRPLGPKEMAFFEHGTEGVPVIAVFTKFEWRITKAFSQLREEGKPVAQARREAVVKAMADFNNIQRQRFANMRYLPAYCVYLREMDKPSGNCEELREITRQLVQNEVNQQLFSEIKHSDIKVTVAIALVQ